MAGQVDPLRNPFLGQPAPDPLRVYQPLSIAERLALASAPRRSGREAPRPTRPPRTEDLRHAGPGAPIDLSKARPGDEYIADSVRVRIGDDGRPRVVLAPGYEDGRSAATNGPLFIPPGPDNASVEANIAAAAGHSPLWFADRVRGGHPWDYRQNEGPQYEAFGNFNYGAAGAGLLPDEVLQRGAGAYQIWRGSKPSVGNPVTGSGAYGDDPVDQFWIRQGVRYHDERH